MCTQPSFPQTSAGRAESVEDCASGNCLFFNPSPLVFHQRERKLGRCVARLIGNMDTMVASLGPVAGEAGRAAEADADNVIWRGDLIGGLTSPARQMQCALISSHRHQPCGAGRAELFRRGLEEIDERRRRVRHNRFE